MLYDNLSTPALRQIARMCGAQGRAQAALQQTEAQRAGQEIELRQAEAATRRAIEAALIAQWPGLERLRAYVTALGTLATSDDGALTFLEVERLRFVAWLIQQRRLGADDREAEADTYATSNEIHASDRQETH